MLAPVVAWDLSGTPSRAWQLLQGAVDVAASAVRGNSYGVDPSSVSIVEAGPGRVSSMEYVIRDPGAAVSVSVGDAITLWDTTLDMPVFRGWVESYQVRALGPSGRTIDVTAIGIEAALDWMYVPPMTLAAGTAIETGFQAIAAQAIGIGFDLRTGATGGTSQLDTPIGIGYGFGVPTVTAWTWQGGTLRQALQGFTDAHAADYPNAFGGQTREQLYATVDFYGGLRVWLEDWTDPTAIGTTLVYGVITLDATAGTARPGSTAYGVNASGTPRSVYVKGGTGGGVGAVGDGSGVIGPTAVVTQSASTTVAQRNGYAAAYLSKSSPGISGTVEAEGTVGLGTKGSQFTWIRAHGSILVLTDPQVGLAVATDLHVAQIAKRIAPSGEQTWTITFGADLPRAAVYLRALTGAVIQ